MQIEVFLLIFIPDAISGILIAGADPLLAAEYHIIVYLMIGGGGLIIALIVIYLSRKKLFNDDLQLAEWIL